MIKNALVWFKTDLRLHDNETLVRAVEQSDEIIPVYCFDESHFKTTEFGFKKTGNFRTQNVFGTNKMINACWVVGKGFNLFDYDTRATNNGFTHEVASGHATTKRGYSVSSIHGSTTIIGDHNDSLFNLFVGDFSITTGTFPKYFVTSNNAMNDMN